MRYSKNFLYCLSSALLLLDIGCLSPAVDSQKDPPTVTRHETADHETPTSTKTEESPLVVQQAVQQLEHHLQNPLIPEKLKELHSAALHSARVWDIFGDRERAKKANEPKGGRGNNQDWLKNMFKDSEENILKSLKDLDGPPTWDLATIDAAYKKALAQKEPDPNVSLPTFTLIKGLSANYLSDFNMGAPAIVQLASQFNFLESVNSDKMPVSSYLSDTTQGPQGSIEAAAAALHRTAAESVDKLPHALINVLEGDYSLYYKNGYLKPYKLSENELKQVVEIVQKNISRLRFLPQWANCEATGKVQLQIFSAAPSYQDYSMPEEGSLGAQLCDILLSTQYEAIAKIAVIRHVATKEEFNVHLTLVGQGAFRNPPSVLEGAFSKVAAIVKGYPGIKIFIHGFNASGQDLVRKASKDSFLLKERDKEEFIKDDKSF